MNLSIFFLLNFNELFEYSIEIWHYCKFKEIEWQRELRCKYGAIGDFPNTDNEEIAGNVLEHRIRTFSRKP